MKREEIRARLACQGCTILEQEPMSSHTSFKIGGPAEFLALPQSRKQLAGLLREARALALPVLVVGKGSNLLVSDAGISGLVIGLGEEFSAIQPQGEDGLYCQAGASMASVCKAALERGLTGLEFAWGLPGSLGGAVYMNAGAYGGQMEDVVERADHLTRNGQPDFFAGEELAYSYRESAYMATDLCITGAMLRLKKGDPAEIKAKMEDLGRRRREKQPLEYPSAGSTFRRPVGGYASALIDQCGLKGLGVGGAMVSEKHAGFVINTGGATCAQVLELTKLIHDRVLEATGISLELEVKLVGEGLPQ